MTSYHLVIFLRTLTLQAVLFCCSQPLLKAQHQAPKIVFIIADQMRRVTPAEYTSKYCSDDIELPPFIHPTLLSLRLEEEYRLRRYDKLSEADLKETMRYYYAAIKWGVGYQIGQVLKALRDQRVMDNTIVIFSSDHGDYIGEYHMVRKGMF